MCVEYMIHVRYSRRVHGAFGMSQQLNKLQLNLFNSFLTNEKSNSTREPVAGSAGHCEFTFTFPEATSFKWLHWHIIFEQHPSPPQDHYPRTYPGKAAPSCQIVQSRKCKAPTYGRMILQATCKQKWCNYITFSLIRNEEKTTIWNHPSHSQPEGLLIDSYLRLQGSTPVANLKRYQPRRKMTEVLGSLKPDIRHHPYPSTFRSFFQQRAIPSIGTSGFALKKKCIFFPA